MQRLRIASPCPMKWENMPGTDRLRHCASCNLNVHNFAAMTPSEIGEVLAASEGRVCGRLVQRRQRRRRFRTAVLAAFLSLSLSATSTASARPRWWTKRSQRQNFRIEHGASVRLASVTGIVNDESGYPLPGVTVTVQNEENPNEIHQTNTDVSGAFAIDSLKDGTYRVEVTLEGLEPMVQEHVALKENDIARAQITLRFDANFTVLVGVIVLDPAPGTTPTSMTFTEEFMRNMPLGGN